MLLLSDESLYLIQHTRNGKHWKITLKEILGAIGAYVKKYKKYPTYDSGEVNIDYSKNITKKTTWQ